MAFERKDRARVYVPIEGDTLRSIAERETAAGNPITWSELARYNWGTDDEVEIDAFLRDELGTRHRGPDNHMVLSPDDQGRGRLLIPQRFKQSRLSLDREYTIRVRQRSAPPQFLGCCSLPGITFGFNSSFVRPSVVEHLQPLEALAAAHPSSKIMIFGHTDAVGDDIYNKKLSERRAWSVHAFITNDPDAWETLYNHPDEQWGAPVLREILEDLGYDPGGAGGGWDTKVRAALRAFLGLPEGAPVENDPATRRRLFAAYMSGKHDILLTGDRFMDPGYMGCGEFNPVAAGEDRVERNRRVTFYLFHPERLPNLPCSFASTAPCQRQMASPERRHRKGYRCSFYDSLARECGCDGPVILATLRIRLFDAWSRPMTEAPYKLTVADSVLTGRAGKVPGAVPADASWVEAKLPVIPDRALIEWGACEEGGDASDSYPYRLELYLDHASLDDSEDAAIRRLHNLGYPSEAPTMENLRTFQFFHRLTDTGLLDEQTVAILESSHDRCTPAGYSGLEDVP